MAAKLDHELYKDTTFCDVTECSSVEGHKYLAGTLLRHISALKEGAKFSDKSVMTRLPSGLPRVRALMSGMGEKFSSY